MISVIMLTILGIIVCVYIVAGLSYYLGILPSYVSCEKMTSNHSSVQMKQTYKDFLWAFHTRTWYTDSTFTESFFSPGYTKQDKIHAGIFVFGGIGYIFSPWDWIKVKRFLKKTWKPNSTYHPNTTPLVKSAIKSIL